MIDYHIFEASHQVFLKKKSLFQAKHPGSFNYILFDILKTLTSVVIVPYMQGQNKVPFHMVWQRQNRVRLLASTLWAPYSW